LFTSDWLTAQEAHALGMVNHVVPSDELADFTLALAVRIAEKPMFALKLAKEAVNAAEDAQGRAGAMQPAFALHQLAHSHNMQVHGMAVDPTGLQVQPKAKVWPSNDRSVEFGSPSGADSMDIVLDAIDRRILRE